MLPVCAHYVAIMRPLCVHNIAKEAFVIRDRSTHFSDSRKSTLGEELTKVSLMGVVDPAEIHRGINAAQVRESHRRYEATCRTATIAISQCAEGVIGEGYTDCSVFNTLVHDFGTEKIRFVNESAEQTTRR